MSGDAILYFGCMKRIILALLLVAFTSSAFGQSKSVDRFRNRYKADVSLFFYKSTLRMFARLSSQLTELNARKAEEETLEEIPDLSLLIEGIEKVKYFMYEQSSDLDELFKTLESDVKEEGYESVMTANIKGSNINIMMREKRGNPDGFVVIMESDAGMSLIDLEGMPDLSNLMKFSEFMGNNTDSFNLLKEAFN